MTSIDEKRVYGDRTDRTELLVAAGVGLVTVSASGGRVGEFGVAHQCSPRDVAARDGAVAVATDEGVLRRDGDEYRGTDFGPAVAVGFDDDELLAADADGRVARHDGQWRTVGHAGTVNAIDGDLIAADDGVYRIDDDVSEAGLDDVRDVTAAGTPLAATAEGLHALGNGWMLVAEGDFRAVASDGDRAHAATTDALHERVGNVDGSESNGPGDPTPDGERHGGREWRAVDIATDQSVIDVAYGDAPYAVTGEGTILAPAEEWRAHPLGLSGASAIAAIR